MRDRIAPPPLKGRSIGLGGEGPLGPHQGKSTAPSPPQK